jgi:hypothetical protein
MSTPIGGGARSPQQPPSAPRPQQPVTDGKVEGLNQGVFTTLQNIQKQDGGNITEASAKTLRKAIMQDGKIDAAEKDLLLELTQGTSKISVKAQPSANFQPNNLSFSPATAKAKESLQLLTKPVDLEKLWNSGPEGMQQMVDLYDTSPALANSVKQFVAQKLFTAWSDSTILNGYKPIRDALSQSYDVMKNMGSDSLVSGRKMLYESMKGIADYVGSAMPDFLYNWLK